MNFLLRIEYILLFDFGVINTTNGDYEKHVPSVALRDAVYIHNFIHHRMVAKKIIVAVCFSFLLIAFYHVMINKDVYS